MLSKKTQRKIFMVFFIIRQIRLVGVLENAIEIDVFTASVEPHPTIWHFVPRGGVFLDRFIGPNVLVVLNGFSS